MGKVPNRWTPYSQLGKRIQGTRFICFKVPLSPNLTSSLGLMDQFSPEILLERCSQIGLVIDLTNTTRFYNPQEFIKRGVRYEKLTCPGQTVPTRSTVNIFFGIVDSFLQNHMSDDLLVGVHCTHGVNRTGYLVCSYMMQRMNFSFPEALQNFESARGHKIERANYIEELRQAESRRYPKDSTHSRGSTVLRSKEHPIAKSPIKRKRPSLDDMEIIDMEAEELKLKYRKMEYDEKARRENPDRGFHKDIRGDFSESERRFEERERGFSDTRLPLWEKRGSSMMPRYMEQGTSFQSQESRRPTIEDRLPYREMSKSPPRKFAHPLRPWDELAKQKHETEYGHPRFDQFERPPPYQEGYQEKSHQEPRGRGDGDRYRLSEPQHDFPRHFEPRRSQERAHVFSRSDEIGYGGDKGDSHLGKGILVWEDTLRRQQELFPKEEYAKKSRFDKGSPRHLPPLESAHLKSAPSFGEPYPIEHRMRPFEPPREPFVPYGKAPHYTSDHLKKISPEPFKYDREEVRNDPLRRPFDRSPPRQLAEPHSRAFPISKRYEAEYSRDPPFIKNQSPSRKKDPRMVLDGPPHFEREKRYSVVEHRIGDKDLVRSREPIRHSYPAGPSKLQERSERRPSPMGMGRREREERHSPVKGIEGFSKRGPYLEDEGRRGRREYSRERGDILRGEWKRGEGMRGEEVRGDSVRVEWKRGEGVRGDGVRGEVVRGDWKRGESIREENLRGEWKRGENMRGEWKRGEIMRGERMREGERSPFQGGRRSVSPRTVKVYQRDDRPKVKSFTKEEFFGTSMKMEEGWTEAGPSDVDCRAIIEQKRSSRPEPVVRRERSPLEVRKPDMRDALKERRRRRTPPPPARRPINARLGPPPSRRPSAPPRLPNRRK